MITVFLALFLFGFVDDFQAQWVSGLKALSEQNFASAQTYLQSASRLRPANPRVWAALAHTYWKLQKTALATEAAGKAEKLGTDDPITWHSLAIFYSEEGKFAEAGDMEAKYAAKDRKDLHAVTRAMSDYLQANQPKKAINLGLATEGWDQRADIRNLLGKAYEADGQILKTIPELREAIQLEPGEESYYFDLINVLLRHYNFDVAITVAEIGAKRFPKSAQLALAAGVAYYGKGLPDKAIDAFLDTIACDPSVEQPYLFLSLIVNKAGDRLPLITQRFVDYQENNPRSYLGYFLHAKALDGQFKEPELAESLLRKSIALNGEYWESHYELGSVLDKKGAFDEAEKEFRRSTELNPKEPSTYYRLSRVLAKLGRIEEARSAAALERKASEASRAAVEQRLAGVKHLEISVKDPDGPKQPK